MDPARELLETLGQATREYCEGERLALLFSGGLDSALIARLARDYCPLQLYTVGVKGAHDLKVSEETADQLQIPWSKVVVSEREIIDSLPRLSNIIQTENPLILSFEMPLYLISSRCEERLLITGQGADELFAGYARYQAMGDNELRANLENDLRELLDVGIKREKAVAVQNEKELRYPYLHPKVIDFARSLPIALLINGNSRKILLREAAGLLDLKDVAERPKKAAQYGSGIMKVMKAKAKSENLTMKALIRSLKDEGGAV